MIYARIKHQTERLAGSLRTILSEAPWNRQVEIHLLVNPVAGGVAKPGQLEHSVETIEAYAAGLHDKKLHAVRVTTHLTKEPGHARRIVAGLTADAGDHELVVVSAGGDGTHGEVLTALVEAPAGVDATAVRLPMGTGNDGADAPTFGEACGILRFGTLRRRLPFVRVTDARGRNHYAFNIVSLGLDAYVTVTGNKFKRVFPGDIYKAVADVSTLFYEPAIGIKEMSAEVHDGKRRIETISGRFIIFAVGATGHRNYGDGKAVLPGEENLCAIRTVGIRRKLTLKSLLYEGKHVEEPEVTMRRCTRVTIDYPGKIPMQLDGEGLWLSPDCFPLVFEVTHAAVGRLVLDGIQSKS
jgi:diacylglycerol kinase family enzyme